MADRYKWNIKSRVNMSDNFGQIWADSDAKAIAYVGLLQAATVNHAKVALSKAVTNGTTLKDWTKYQVPATGNQDRKYGFLTFTDSAHPDKKFYLNYPAFIGTEGSQPDMEALGAAIVALELNFKVKGDDTVYNLDTYVPPRTSNVIDDFAEDVTSDANAPA